MTNLFDLITKEELSEMLEGGYVSSNTHPSEPLTIYNYRDSAMYERMWNDTTKLCRGLIVNSDTHEIVARSFYKFFNYGEPGAAFIDHNEAVRVTDKLDGFLGVLYPTADGYAVSSRGSFESPMAKRATQILHEKYSDYVPPVGWTPVFEIIYPNTDLILSYGDMEDLVCLALINNDTGESRHPSAEEVPFPVVDVMNYHTLAEALGAPNRENVEGLVVESLSTGNRIKLKQDSYMELVRVTTGLSYRAIWHILKDGRSTQHLYNSLPEELHPMIEKMELTFYSEAFRLMEEAYDISKSINFSGDRKTDYATVSAVAGPLTTVVMKLGYGEPYSSWLWTNLGPDALRKRGININE